MSSTCGDARLPEETAAAWLSAFPRVLWAAGAKHPDAAAALVASLHDLARLAVQVGLLEIIAMYILFNCR
jgi:class 3 adenylate cyclase